MTRPISILVPYRAGDVRRELLWRLIRARYETFMPQAEIVACDDDGGTPFSRAIALNRAAERASGEVFCLTDSDTWLDPANLDVDTSERWWRPWNVKVKLGPSATERILDLGARWDGTITEQDSRTAETRNTFWAAAPVVVPRAMFEAVGGFDPGFRGWGAEDEAFGLALRALFGQPRRREGTAIHLYHPRLGRSGADLWEGQASRLENRLRANRYRAVGRSPERMRRLIAERV